MANETTTERRWITINEAAVRVRRSAYTVRRWIKEGSLPPGTVHRPIAGGPFLIDPDVLDEWVRNGCFTVPAGEPITVGGAAAS
jgi:excisionase family DNA binding protein